MNEQTPPRPPVGPAAGDASPLIELEPLIRCGAGTLATFEVFITHRGPAAALLRVTVLGLDSRWVPPPLPVGPIEPGETTRVTLSLVPERGTLGAKYPFVVAVEATPVNGRIPPTMGVAESVLAVDGRDPITMTVSPQTPVAVFGRRIKVQITNPGHFDRELNLSSSAARGAALSLSSTMVTIPAGRTVTVPGRVRVTHPKLIGGQNTHTFAVAARGLGAPEFAEGTLRSKPMLGGRLTGLLVAVLVIAVWATAAIVGIPKLSNAFKGNSAADATATAHAAPGAANATTSSGAAGGAAGSASGSTNGSGGAGGSAAAGPGGSAAAGAGAAGGAAAGAGAGEASGARLSGTVTGITPKGVSVSLEPTSLVEAAAAGAQPAAGATDATTATALRAVSTGLYKIPGDALRLAPTVSDSGVRATTSAADGTFSFAGITAPGYYLLTLAKAGFATQRFMINASTLAAAPPIKVALVAGNGSMSGKVTSPSGSVGAATVVITDGTVALQTSAASKTGAWTVKGLSTPGTYLVTVSSTGFGASSKLVTLAAGGTGTADLTLIPGVAAINGTVSGVDGLGHLGGIGGVTVTATGTSKGVAASRTATTVTSGPVGTYALPDLPVPGQYTVTVSGTGFASQTQQVSLAQGSSSATVNISLTRADGTVTGSVSGGGRQGGLIGAGLTLTGADATYKTMTTSAPAGAYRFTGVPPGTYVLQGSQYGRLPSSATVVVAAAGTAVVNLTLIGAPDTELPATSRITGRVVDSRTQGPLTCDRSADPKAVCRVTATAPIPVPGSTNGATETISAISGPAENYTLPGIDDKKHGGLVAGLYAVTLSAPGYEATTVQVQVAQGQVNPAAQVGLPPLGLITGTVTTRVGSTATASCVVSVPAGIAVPTICTPTSATACIATGSTAARCSMTKPDGTYEIRGLVHGGYDVVVIPTDREYLPTTPLSIQLDLGGDYRYDAILDRLGRATITVLQPNLTSLVLSPAKGAVIGLVDTRGVGRGNPLPGDSTSDDGILTITGLLGSYSAVAAGDIPTGLTTGTTSLPGKATAATGIVGLNQTVAITEVLTAPVGAVVGHVTVSVDGQARDVTNAPVQISGVVGFSGRSSVSGTVTVTTDSNGCYAIVPVNWSNKYPLVSPDCPTAVAGGSVGTMAGTDGSAASLVALPLGISVTAQGLKTQSYSASGVLIGFNGSVSVIPPISLLAQPSVFPGLSLDLKAPAGVATDASGARILVTRKPAGAGNITVTATANGSLTWTDSNLGTGKAVPGTYVLQATLSGYSSAGSAGATGMASGYATVWCDLGAPCRFGTSTVGSTATAWTMSQLPSITGIISAAILPRGVTLDQTVISVVAKPSASGSISATVDRSTGSVTYLDTSLPAGLAQPTAAGAPYIFTVALAGYRTATVSIDCGATYLQGCTQENAVPANAPPLSVTLIPLPRFSGSITIVPAVSITGETLAGVSISVNSQPNPAKPVVVGIANTTGLTSPLTWQDPSQPDSVVSFGDYSFTFSKVGYQPVTQLFSCPTGATSCVFNSGNPISVVMFPRGAGTVTVDQLLPGTTSVDWSKAVVTLGSAPAGTAGLKIKVVQAPNPRNDPVLARTGAFVWTDSGLPANLAGITQPTTGTVPYVLNVSIPGYGSGSSAAVTCDAGGICNPTVTGVNRLAAFAGTVATKATVTPDNTGGLVGVTANVTRQPNPGVTITVGINTTSGVLSWSDPTQPPGIVAAGSYEITFAKNGYQSVVMPFTCGTNATCGPGTVTLLEFPSGAGTVSVAVLLPGTTKVDWASAKVTVTSAPADTAGLKVTVVQDPSKPLTGDFVWTDSGLPYVGITRPTVGTGNYLLTVSLPGYASGTSTSVSCLAGGTCAPVAGPLGRLATFVGAVATQPSILPDTTGGLVGVTATVTAQPNPGVQIDVGVNTASGALSWSDPTQPAGVVTAGTYTVSFAKSGYKTVSSTFTCSVGATCGTGGTPVIIPELPHGVGSVSVTALAPGASSIDWSQAKLTILSQNPPSTTLAITLVPDGTPKELSAAFAWADSGLPFAGITKEGVYTIQVSLPGYGSVTSASFTCTAGLSCGPTLVLTKQPTFTGSVTTDPTGGSLVGAAISVISPAGVNAVNATVAATAADPTNGTISWQEAGAPAGLVSFGTYQVSVTGPGYLPYSTSWTCSSATTCPALSLVLTSPSTLQVKVVSSADGTTPVNGALFNLSGTLITGSTVSAAATSNTVSFPGESPFGDYTVNVHAAGYANGTFSKTATTASCTNGTTTKTGFLVLPGGTTVCTVQLSPLGKITLHTVGTSGAGSTVVLASTAVTVVRLDGNGTPTGATFSGTTSATGDLVITGTTADDGLLAGTWQVTAAQTGYRTAVGTVLITSTFAMAENTGGPNPFKISAAGVLQVPLTVNPVELQVHLTLGTAEILPAVKVAVTGPGTALSCTVAKSAAGVYSCTETTNTGTVVSGTAQYVDFAAVNPGVYTVSVTSPSATYRTVTLLASVVAGVSPQQLVITLDQRSSTQSGKIVLADGSGNVGVTASLRPEQNIGVVATDQDSNPLSVKTDKDGNFTFTGIPDGRYTLVGTFTGYATGILTPVVMDSSLNNAPPALSKLTLTTRASRSVNVTLTSTAAASTTDTTGVNLGGAQVTLTPTGAAIAGLGADQPQVLTLPTTGPYTVNIPQLPTGTWTATIGKQANTPFDGALTGETVVVPEGPVSATAPPAVAAPLTVQQALATLTVSWGDNSCLTPPAVSPATLALNITNTTSGVTTKTPVAATVTGTTAVAQVYLPEGSYTFRPTPDNPQWTPATDGAFNVGTIGSADTDKRSNPATPTVALVPAQVPVAVSMTVDGAGSKADGLSVLATNGGTTTPTQALAGGGKATVCVAPGAPWTFKVSSPSPSQKISIPVQVINTVADPDAGKSPPDNTVAFTAFTVTPLVALQDVAGRVDTTGKDVDVTISNGDGQQVYTGLAAGVVPSSAAVPGVPASVGPPAVAAVPAVPASPGKPASAQPVILGTCTGCTYAMTATPQVAGVFSAVTAQTLTPSTPSTFDVTLPYNAAMVTVTVNHGTPAVASAGATVTLTGSTITAGPTGTDGKTLFQDVPVATQTFSATWTDTSVTPNTTLTGTTTVSTLAAGADAVTILVK